MSLSLSLGLQIGAVYSSNGPDVTPPTSDVPIYNATTGAFEITGVSEGGTFYTIVNYSATVLTGAAIEALYAGGTADASLSFAVAAGVVSGTLDTSLVLPGTAYLHTTIKDAAGNYMTDVPVSFTQPAIAYVNQHTNTVELIIAADQLANSELFTLAGSLRSVGTGASVHRIAKNGQCWFGYFPSTTEFYVSLKNAAGTQFYEAYYNTMDLLTAKHIIFATDGNNVGFWVDGVEQTASNVVVAFTTGNTLDLDPAWEVFCQPSATNSLKADQLGQFFMDNYSMIDFTSAATKAASVKQIYNGGVLKNFANLPYTPKVAFGDDMVLADWNKATNVVENVGAGSDPARTGAFA